MKNEKQRLIKKISESITTWKYRCSRMNFITSVMIEENSIISEQKQKNRVVIRRLLRCMDVQTAVAANTKQAVSTNIMRKEIVKK